MDKEQIERLKQYILIINSLKNDKMNEYVEEKYIEYTKDNVKEEEEDESILKR